ncbi:hypothetical protein FE257_010784 [Aspergillus nanangensis]|uniref:Major facilitator superfamily (MFS) profile domain-containing protein n=1 Tax=Aspergillus nanangensis TaxID=2582783 RepID=A0AAD4GXZ7_ASPNN|nr:hypothetical protein FE257_010784 [Aspergillus nanangensis]
MEASTGNPISNLYSTQSPGTVLLIQQQCEGDIGHEQADGTVILMPQPANTVNDPLNWTRGQKIWHYAIHLLWVFLANARYTFLLVDHTTWTSPAWTVWTIDLNTDYTTLTYGQALLIVMCGIGVLFIQPWATKHGRRLPYLLGSSLIICGLLCGRFMADSRLYFAYQLVAGFGSAPAYSTIITSLLDVSFLHQRGSVLGLFGLFLMAGNFVPPIVAGYIVDKQGWPWCFNYLLIFFGVSSIILLVGAEESLFARDTFQTHNICGAEVARTSLIPEQSDPVENQCDKKQNTGTTSTTLDSTSGDSRPFDTRRLSYRQKMTLYRQNPDVKAGYWRLTFAIFEVAMLPAAIWMSIMFSLSSFVVGVVLTTLALFFSAPPYNFNAATMGLMYLPILIGAVLGSVWGGPCTDWLLLRLSRRNEGIYEPEYRLWTYLLIPVVGAAGVLLYGVGAAQGLHWIVPCLGLVFIGVYLDASTPIAMGFALDCYPDLEDQVVQLSNFLRNVLGGAITFGLQPWITYSGAQNTIIIIATVVFMLNATSVGFQFWGKWVRSRSARKYFNMRDRAHRLDARG